MLATQMLSDCAIGDEARQVDGRKRLDCMTLHVKCSRRYEKQTFINHLVYAVLYLQCALYRGPGLHGVKGSVCYFWKFALPPFSPPLP